MSESKAGPSTIPVTILTGFLGAGKTTLLKHLLSNAGARKVAVIENEYGLEMGLDADGLKGAEGALVEQVIEFRELAGGCACCSIRGDLLRTLQSIAAMETKYDHLIIETTGLADPHPIANVLFAKEDGLTELYHLNAVVTVVDASNFTASLADTKPEGSINEAERQVVAADLVVINKTDLVGEAEVAALTTSITSLNGTAKCVSTRNSVVDVETVLGSAVALNGAARFGEVTHHVHDSTVTTVGVVEAGEYALDKVEGMLATWLATPSAAAAADDDDVGMVCGPDGCFPIEEAKSALPSPFKMILLPTKKEEPAQSKEVFRAKGLLRIAGKDRAYRLEGVRDSYSLTETSEPAPKESRLVLIGRGLDWKEAQEAFLACQPGAAAPIAPLVLAAGAGGDDSEMSGW